MMAIEPLADRFARRRAEHRGQQRAAVFQRQQLRGVFPHHGHRTVGGAVVKTNKHRLQNPHAGEEGGDFSGSPPCRQLEFKSKALTVKGDYH
jgi:hypothetical protein